MYTLYGFPYSQHYRRVVSLLEETGLSYELVTVDLSNGEHFSEDYLRINPNHQVPTLVDGRVTLHESNAILRYLCNKHQLAEWYPVDPAQRAQVDQWLDWVQCQMSPAVVNIVFNSVFLGDKGDADAIAQGKEAMAELWPIIDQALESDFYLGASNPTIADLAMVSNVFQLGLAQEVAPSKPTQAWYQRMLTLKGVQRSVPDPVR